MTVGELKKLLATAPDDLDVEIRTPDKHLTVTANYPIFAWFEVEECVQTPGCSIADPAFEIRLGKGEPTNNRLTLWIAGADFELDKEFTEHKAPRKRSSDADSME